MGIVAIVFSVIGLLTSMFVIPAFIFGIPSIILGIITLRKQGNKVLGILSIVFSSIALLIAIGFIIVYSFLYSLGSSIDSESIGEALTTLYNEASEGITSELDVANKLDGHTWEMADGSILELRSNGTFYWYEYEVSDNYYYGTYSTEFGDEAISKIDEEYGWNEEGFSYNTQILRTDVYYLELVNQSFILDDEEQFNGEERTSKYYIVFYNNSYTEATGLNMQTMNEVYLERVD